VKYKTTPIYGCKGEKTKMSNGNEKGDLEEALAIIDDDSTNPDGSVMSDKDKAMLKEVVTKAFEEA
jgi:hypothetical protein